MYFLPNSQSKFDQEFSKNGQFDDNLISLNVTLGLLTWRLCPFEIDKHCVPGTISCHGVLMISALILPQSRMVVTIVQLQRCNRNLFFLGEYM